MVESNSKYNAKRRIQIASRRAQTLKELFSILIGQRLRCSWAPLTMIQGLSSAPSHVLVLQRPPEMNKNKIFLYLIDAQVVLWRKKKKLNEAENGAKILKKFWT